jgi:hypothetical protein
MIKEISQDGKLLAIIIPHNFQSSGIEFFTPDNFSQQLAYMQHPIGKTIQPHVHRPLTRNVQFTQEVLVIRKGKLRVDFYNDNQEYLESHILIGGDTILLAGGGHGFEVLESIEMIEVKQGPYTGEHEKTKFEGVAKQKIKIKP